MKELRKQLDLLLKQSGVDKSTIEVIENEKVVFPFSTEGRILAYLLATQTIDYEKYMELHNEYAKRNQYLDLFEMAPRTFGETWGEKHILGLFPEFVKATKENIASIYPNFDGEFDLWLDGIRVEVKACRANGTKTGKLGSQHRNENTGVAGVEVFEGQVFMTEDELKPFLVDEKDVLNVVRRKGR